MFNNNDRMIKSVYKQAKEEYNFKIPPIEIACLLRKLLTGKDMKDIGLKNIIVMHYPVIEPETGLTQLLSVNNFFESWLTTIFTNYSAKFHKETGFAFLI